MPSSNLPAAAAILLLLLHYLILLLSSRCTDLSVLQAPDRVVPLVREFGAAFARLRLQPEPGGVSITGW